MFCKRLVELHQRIRYSCAVRPKIKFNASVSKAVVHLSHQPPTNCLSVSTVRYASTNSAIPPVITKAIEASSPTADATLQQTSIESLVESIGPIPEVPGLPPPKVLELLSNGEPSLSSLGIGGYSPSGILQHILEFVHVTTGLGWGATIIIVAATIRALCFKLVVRQRQESAKFSAVMPQMQYLQQKMTEARQQNDLIQASRYGIELTEFYKHNPSMFGPLKYGIVQAGILLSFTHAIRQMCNLPVESLTTGGFFTIVDLTMKDPTMVLPFINGLLLYLHFVTGKELKSMFPTTRPIFIQIGTAALGTGLFLISCNFQVAIVLYWISSQFVTVIQHKILSLPKVQAHYNLQVKGSETVAEMMKKEKLKKEQRASVLGFWARVKEAQTNNRLADEVKRRTELDSAAFERAGREPIRKTFKYDVTKSKQK